MNVLGIDLGGTHVRAVVCSGSRWRALGRSRLPERPRELAQVLSDFARRVDRVGAVGAATAPAVDARGQVTSWPNRPEYVGFRLGDALRAAFGRSASVLDDCAAGAVAEHVAATFEDPSRRTTTLYIGVGTGIGAGLVVADRLYLGARMRAMGLGHLPVPGIAIVPCGCGRSGCLQTAASGRALERLAHELGLDIPGLAALAARGEPRASRVMDDALAALARGVWMAATLLDPHRVVVGGAVVRAGALAAEALADKSRVELRRPIYGDWSAAIGAAIWRRIGRTGQSLYRCWHLDACATRSTPIANGTHANRIEETP